MNIVHCPLTILAIASMKKLNHYFSLIKFAHTVFAMPFALIGFFLGIKALSDPRNIDQRPSPGWHITVLTPGSSIFKFLLVLLCMVFARSAAMAFNRWLDASYDKKNPRTAAREIPAGIIKSSNAFWFVAISCVAFVICCWFINLLCFYLSFIALFVILFYSYTKRFTALCHLVLGLGLSLAPIGSYIAVTGTFALLPLLFSVTVLCWVSGFDIIYALQDEEFDRLQQLHSIPAALGKTRALRISELLHILSAAAVIFAGFYGQFGRLYWTGVAVFSSLLIYQHLLVKPTDLSKVNMAFFTTNGIASIVFGGFVVLDLYMY